MPEIEIKKKPEAAAEQQGYNFGTFKGVFTPSILTILGVIMYLRFGWVLGNLGLGLTLLTVTLASAITFVTGLSLTALASNMRVGGGGAYFIISRSLGIEAGAAIGVPLFFAQAFGISFYLSGFAEALHDVWPLLTPEAYAIIALLILTIVTYLSADIALKIQLAILGLITLSLVSFFLGGSSPDLAAPAGEAPQRLPFWLVFAVFFPAVTGIEAGIAMSGDLKDPAKSLSRGTILAVLTGFIIYLAIPVFLSTQVADRNVLLTDTLIMSRIAKWGFLIVVGVLAASLSSAAGSLLGAPRTLQALARDGVLPRFVGRGYGKTDDPRIASVLSFVVALSGILMGGLNVIAPILTMFFLTSYGLLNISAGLEELLESPAWRPKMRIPAWISLVGSFGCFAVMFMINAGATFLAAFVSAGIFLYMKKRRLNARWEDIRAGILMLMAQFAIRKLSTTKPDGRTWKPNVLVVCGPPDRRLDLIELADALAQKESALTIATPLPPESWSTERVQTLKAAVNAHLKKRDIRALVKVLPSESVVNAAEALVKAYGFGPLIPNTILLGESGPGENWQELAHLIALIYRLERNLVIVHESKRENGNGEPRSEPKPIHVWLRGGTRNSGLMLTLAAVMQRDEAWQQSPLLLHTIVDTEAEKEAGTKRLQEIIESHRLKADFEIRVKGDEPVYEQIKRSSQGAGVIFVGMREPQPGESVGSYAEYYKNMLTSMAGYPPTAIVLAAEDIKFSEVMERE